MLCPHEECCLLHSSAGLLGAASLLLHSGFCWTAQEWLAFSRPFSGLGGFCPWTLCQGNFHPGSGAWVEVTLLPFPAMRPAVSWAVALAQFFLRC